MNRVHEQCPKIDSGTILSQTGSKKAECTECIAYWPISTPRLRMVARTAPVPRVSQARLPRAPAAPACLRALCRVPAPLRASLVVSWLGWALYCNTAQPCLALMSQYSPVYCDTTFLQQSLLQYNPCQVYLLLQYNKLYCNIVSPAARLLKSQYNYCIAIQIHSLLSCFLQYNFNIAIRIFFFHNTIGQ